MLALYKEKYKLTFLEASHKYLINGEAKPGVTSILGILNKPGLPQWAANQATEFIKSEADQVPNEKAWIVTEETLYKAKHAFNQRRDNSADIGKKVHKWLEDHVNRKLAGGEFIDDKYDEDMAPSVESFLKWEEKYSPEYVFSERVVYSEKGDYCGTCDVGIKINDEYIILDFKTGKPEKQYDRKTRRYTGRTRPYSTLYIQTALYDLAIEEEDGIRADKYGALYLSTNGDILFSTTPETEAFRIAGRNIVGLNNALRKIDYLNKWN